MTQKVQALYERALQELTPEERTELVELLSDSMDLDGYWRGELRRRVTEIEAGRARFVSEEELDQQFQQILDQA